MSRRCEVVIFAVILGGFVAVFFHESLFRGMVLGSGDVVFTTASFSTGGDFEPANRLLMDPVLQFEPWLEFTRSEVRAGRLPLWNPLVGCGAPHLANGQSAVFDPFHAIAYLGTLPKAIAWMAAARLWVAGLGMFLLARSWGQSPIGRWFAGLCYPFCGFLIVWLLYPVTSVAVWMPWLFLATDRALDQRRFAVSGLAIIVSFVMLGGHVQTSAHVLLAAGLSMLWRVFNSKNLQTRGPIFRWTAGIVLGLTLAAIEIVPLASYLSKSPVWSDRVAEKPSILSIGRPRLLDAATTGMPYLFGSQRRGHPNLAKALGVHNLNESAGGFAGLATLIWLAPAAWSARSRHPRVTFFAALGILAILGAFNVPPVPNLLRILPILDVADHRRLTLWLAFSLVLLGGYGLDATARTIGLRRWKIWTRSWVVFAGILVMASFAIGLFGPRIREKAIAHYARSAEETPGADASIYRERAERQTKTTLSFLPRYFLLTAAQLLVLAGLAEMLRWSNRDNLDVWMARVVLAQCPGSDPAEHWASATRATQKRHLRATRIQLVLINIVVADLITFGYNLNPAISPEQDRPDSEVIAYLRREISASSRIISVGAELPPNTLMRYGMADARNYDSIELSRNLDWFADLYEPEPDRPSMRTSRRTITWNGVIRSLERLRLARVTAIVGAIPPPNPEAFSRVDRVGKVWIARLNRENSSVNRVSSREIRIDLTNNLGQVEWVAETFDPGWSVEIDGRPASTIPHLRSFLGVRIPQGARLAIFRYNPVDVRVATIVSLLSLIALGMLANIERKNRSINGDRVLEPGLPSG